MCLLVVDLTVNSYEVLFLVFFFQAEDGIRDLVRSRGLGDVYKRQALGGFLIGIVETLTAGYISPTFKDAIVFSLLIIILLFKPSGLLGKAASEKV